MKPVAGLARPGAQWALVAGAVVLTAALWWTLLELRETRAAARRAAEAVDAASKERAAVDAGLARERAAREALALELGRLRAADERAAGEPRVPTLTLTPGPAPGGAAPEPTVAAPAPAQVVELRLLMPPGAPRVELAQVVARDWSSGDARWTIAGRAAVVEGRRMIRALVTGEMLQAGRYEVQVRGSGDDTLALYVLGIRPQAP